MRVLKLVHTVLCVSLAIAAPRVQAEMSEIRIAYGLGVGFLPMYVMQDHKLVEKHAKADGLGDVTVDWVRLSGGTMMNDGLLSGSLQIASGGITPLIVAWSKTVETQNEIRGLGVISSSPMLLVTRNSKIKSVRDLTAQDRIAMPAAKLAPQSVLLQMVAEKEFGLGKHGALDAFTVSMSHPDATAALLSGNSQVNSHFSTPPYMYEEVADPAIRTILNSNDVLGGPGAFVVMWTTKAFHDSNPRLYGAVTKALDEALEMISDDKMAAARSYVRIFDSKQSAQRIRELLDKPGLEFSRTPRGVMKYADFMSKVGSIKVKPTSWKDIFFPNNHGLSGS